MDQKEFYNYIMETYELDAIAARLVKNIIDYIQGEGYIDAEDAHRQLRFLFSDTFGINDEDIKLYHAPVCEGCLELLPDYNGDIEYILCAECQAKLNHGGHLHENS